MNRCELWAWKLFGSLPDPISSVGTEKHVSCPASMYLGLRGNWRSGLPRFPYFVSTVFCFVLKIMAS